MTKQDRRNMLWLAIASFLFYVWYTWGLTLTDPVESNYVLTAKEMLQKGSFVSPLIFGHAWYDKPPLTYWFLMASFKLFGFTDFAARLPATLTATASIVAMYAATKRLTKDTRTALWSSLILGTTFEFWYISHAVITDGYLFLTSIGIFTFAYLAFIEQKASYIRYAYICSGLAVLTKGPVGIVLPGLVLLAFLALRRQKKDWKILFDWKGLLLFLLVATPWYIAMTKIHGQAFLEGFLGLHNVTRATLSEHPSQDVWYYYLVLTPLALLPWLGLTVYEWKHTLKTSPLRQFQWLWFGVVFLFYTLVATKYITYTFIGFIPLTQLNAQGLVRLLDAKRSRIFTAGLLFIPLGIFAVILGIGAYWEPHIHTLTMAYGAGILLLLLLLAGWKLPVASLPKVVVAVMVAIFLYVPILIQPLLNIRSAELFAPQVEALQAQKTYYYYDYATSYTFYTDKAPMRLLDPVHYPMTIWLEGKDVMPSMSILDLEKQYNPKEKIVIIVEKKRLKNFKTFAFTKDFHEVGHFYQYLYYANFTPNTSK